MDQGRGSAVLATAVLLLLIHSQIAESTIYNVGGRSGWTINTAAWTNGKRFRAGDVLVFKYSSSAHNVVAVGAAGYKGCTARGSRVFKSGNDRIRLAKGRNFFICSLPGHCQAGMKIAVTAA